MVVKRGAGRRRQPADLAANQRRAGRFVMCSQCPRRLLVPGLGKPMRAPRSSSVDAAVFAPAPPVTSAARQSCAAVCFIGGPLVAHRPDILNLLYLRFFNF